MADEAKVTNPTNEAKEKIYRFVVSMILMTLVSHQWISQEFYDQFVKGLPEIVLALGLLGTLAQSIWSGWRKSQHVEKVVDKALDAPAGTTKAEVLAQVPPPPSIVAKITGSGSTPLPMILLLVLTLVPGFAALTTTGCAHRADGKPVIVGTQMSQSDAKRALIAIQDTRTAELKAMAAIYVAAPNSPRVQAAARAVDAMDKQIQEYWAIAAKACDEWDVQTFLVWYYRARGQLDSMSAEVAEAKR